jgi:hypothetical protein
LGTVPAVALLLVATTLLEPCPECPELGGDLVEVSVEQMPDTVDAFGELGVAEFHEMLVHRPWGDPQTRSDFSGSQIFLCEEGIDPERTLAKPPPTPQIKRRIHRK